MSATHHNRVCGDRRNRRNYTLRLLLRGWLGPSAHGFVFRLFGDATRAAAGAGFSEYA